MIQPGQIIKNLIPSEPVVVTRVQPLGNSISISFTGVNSNRANSKVIRESEISTLIILADEGNFNFSGDPVKFSLFAEAERINTAYQFDPLFAVNCSIVDPLPHQVEAVYKFLLPLPKIRFLLADDTGAGKTIMTGLLIKELIMRGLIERVLIVTPGGLTKQWQEDEMGLKFNLPFTLVNRSLFSSDPNIFQTANKVVTSIDFISQEDVLNVAGNSHWDIIVFDECHKLSAYDYGNKVYKSRRYEAAQKLSQLCEHILLLTATPHRGRTDTFKKLLQLLDEDIFATEELASTRVKEMEHDSSNKFFIRRLKEDMKDWNGAPLYKKRFTRTVTYELTAEEKELYDEVTKYLTKRKEEASETKNIHVSLALTVMQRRLVSSIFAIRNTLYKRWQALQSIVDELAKNPNLWTQRHKLEGFDVADIEDYDELEDEDRDSLENILSDPRKFKLFTTAKSINEIRDEAKEVKRLFEMADALYKRYQEEQKYKELQKLLREQNVFGGEKLVIFTEHKDTLKYLEERLTQSGGFKVATIHGGKSVDERREAQWQFAGTDTQILLATDAAGEGINLQFCRLLINWDIPWNPNRLEQRMGRIHRYGQKQDVLVFNMVADNTREGQVLARLLGKLDIIRESLGDDRVYDVIQDVMQNVSMSDIINSVFNGEDNSFNDIINQDTEVLKQQFSDKIKDQRNSLTYSKVDYRDARILKEDSDEKRLQPIYVKMFFEKAFKELGGKIDTHNDHIFKATHLPDAINFNLRNTYNKIYELPTTYFCFDKTEFLKQHHASSFKHLYFLNPGNPLFDSLIKVVRNQFREEMLKGTILVSADDKQDYFAYFVKSQIVDNRHSKGDESIADERLMMIYTTADGDFKITSPAKFIDLYPPTVFAKQITPPDSTNQDEVINWTFSNVTELQLQDTELHVTQDALRRRSYLETSFTQVISDTIADINELQGRIRNDSKLSEKLARKEERLQELKSKKKQRLEELDLMTQLSPKAPEVLGCAFVVPLSQMEYEGNYGMSRDDEAEAIAMEMAMKYEESQGWHPEDVSANNEGYDIRSINPDEMKRYIEVKGRSGADGSVMVSENEMNRLAQLGESSWLYIVINCKSSPELFTIQNPAKSLNFQVKSKGVQYFLPMAEWKAKVPVT
ncbi:MAG: DUF3883 domain-containing protein [Chitinophagales bacterium]|nr:DUF3883 domain-containing protein [Chitinophagales bacterium]